MEKAKVMLVEDDEAILDLLTFALGMEHEVVASARTLHDCHAALWDLAARAVKLDVCITDRHLVNEDASLFIPVIKDNHPACTVIGASGSGEVPGADVQVPKMDSDDPRGFHVRLLEKIAEL
jgi:DNA-binding NtrC family response regulator